MVDSVRVAVWPAPRRRARAWSDARANRPGSAAGDCGSAGLTPARLMMPYRFVTLLGPPFYAATGKMPAPPGCRDARYGSRTASAQIDVEETDHRPASTDHERVVAVPASVGDLHGVEGPGPRDTVPIRFLAACSMTASVAQSACSKPAARAPPRRCSTTRWCGAGGRPRGWRKVRPRLRPRSRNSAA